MFIVLLNFSDNKGQASQFMEGHKKWIKPSLPTSLRHRPRLELL